MSAHPPVDLELIPGDLAICRLEPDSPLLPWTAAGRFTAVARSARELSVICAAESVPEDIRREGPFRGLRVRGPLDFSAVGILAGLTAPLAAAGIPVLAVSTFDTDYLLVRCEALDRARVALLDAGHRFDGGG